MYKRNKTAKLGRKKSHREALRRNMLISLFTYGYITTTSVKAKVLKMDTFKFLSDVKKQENELLLNRKLSGLFSDRSITDRIKEYAKDPKATVSVVKIGFRAGDNAQTSKVELKGYVVKKAVKKVDGKKSKKIAKKVESKEVKPQIVKEKRDLGKTIKETFAGRKTRATSRSGL